MIEIDKDLFYGLKFTKFFLEKGKNFINVSYFSSGNLKEVSYNLLDFFSKFGVLFLPDFFFSQEINEKDIFVYFQNFNKDKFFNSNIDEVCTLKLIIFIHFFLNKEENFFLKFNKKHIKNPLKKKKYEKFYNFFSSFRSSIKKDEILKYFENKNQFWKILTKYLEKKQEKEFWRKFFLDIYEDKKIKLSKSNELKELKENSTKFLGEDCIFTKNKTEVFFQKLKDLYISIVSKLFKQMDAFVQNNFEDEKMVFGQLKLIFEILNELEIFFYIHKTFLKTITKKEKLLGFLFKNEIIKFKDEEFNPFSFFNIFPVLNLGIPSNQIFYFWFTIFVYLFIYFCFFKFF